MARITITCKTCGDSLTSTDDVMQIVEFDKRHEAKHAAAADKVADVLAGGAS